MKTLLALLSLGMLASAAAAQTGSVTIPLGSVTLQPAPPPPVPVTVTATVTVTVNGVAQQAVVNLGGNIAVVAGSVNQYQLTLAPTAATVPLTVAGTHADVPDLQPWLFVSGFADLSANQMPATIKAGDRFLIEGHHFGDLVPGCRVEVNGEPSAIVSWLDNLIVAQAPMNSQSQAPAAVLVWRSPREYYLSMAPFAVAAATP
jgi:hypothetical protein